MYITEITAAIAHRKMGNASHSERAMSPIKGLMSGPARI